MATAEVLRGRFAGIDLDELVDLRVVRIWLYWGMFWLMVMPSVGVALSSLFNYPDYLGSSLELTFGRLRPVHVNGVIFGASFNSFYRRMLLPSAPVMRCSGGVGDWGAPLAWVWNLALVAGLISLPLGWNHAVDQHDLVAPVELVRLAQRKAQRYVGFRRRRPACNAPCLGVAANHVVAAAVTEGAQLLEYPDQRQPLARRLALVCQ